MSLMGNQSIMPYRNMGYHNQLRHINENRESLKGMSENDQSADLKKVCAEMESLFIYMLFKEMRATIPKSGLMKDSCEKDIYTSMLDRNLAEAISHRGGIGLSSILEKQLAGQTARYRKKQLK